MEFYTEDIFKFYTEAIITYLLIILPLLMYLK